MIPSTSPDRCQGPTLKPPSDSKSKIERTLADLSVMSKTHGVIIVENQITKWTNRQQLQTLEAIESPFEDALQVSYIYMNIVFKPALLMVIQKVLNVLVGCSCS